MADRHNSAHQWFWQTSDSIGLAGVVLAGALEWIWPGNLESILPAPYRTLLGGIVLLAGGTFIAQARRELKRGRQPAAPGKPTTRLLTSGIYRWSRNPIYVGMLLVFAGGAMALNWPWLLAATTAMVPATYLLLIRPEESYLARTFGREWEDYRARVRRWL